MIRINLLPGATKAVRVSSGGSQGWIIGYLVSAAVLVLVLGFVYFAKKRTLNEQVTVNGNLSREISDLEAQSANIDEVRGELQRSQALEGVVDELQRARYGPTSVLMELSRILSVGGGPTVSAEELEVIRRNDPTSAPNLTWDPHRLWMTEFREEDRQCTIRGIGKTNQDVAEFLNRLILSNRFHRIELIKTEGMVDQATHLPVISFELTCEVVY